MDGHVEPEGGPVQTPEYGKDATTPAHGRKTDVLVDDIVYQNVGFPTVRGSRRVLAVFRGLDRPAFGFDVAIHRTASDGGVVLNERTDVLIIGPVRLQFWVCGVFEVRDGRITLWRDYFDMFDMTKALVRGLAGAAIPALRPRLR